MTQHTLLTTLQEIEQMERFLHHIHDERTKKEALFFTYQLYAKYEHLLHVDGNKPTILVDMDEVLADLINPWLKAYNHDYQDTLSANDLTDFNTSLFVKPECGQKVYDYLKKPGFFQDLQPLPYAQSFIQNLVDADMRVLIVSDSPAGNSFCDYKANQDAAGNPADDKRKWLATHFPMIPPSHVVFTSQKWFVQGDILVDDKPSTFIEFQKRGRHAILMDQPYNRHLNTPQRAKNLKEAEHLLFQTLNAKQLV